MSFTCILNSLVLVRLTMIYSLHLLAVKGVSGLKGFSLASVLFLVPFVPAMRKSDDCLKEKCLILILFSET